ncbi:MAG: MBL fold metallo-hydrolase, partial [Pyrinomonadaceae bacterium]
TRSSANLVKFAQGTDLLIHEVASLEILKKTGRNDEWIQAIIGHHTTPEQAGEIFSRVRPRLAVYSHVVLPAATEQDLIPPTRKTYSGPLELGEDLMTIEVGDKIEIRRPAKSQ